MLLTYLHGFGYDQTNNHDEISLLAELLELKHLYAFDAPLPSGRERGGYARVPIDKTSKRWLREDKQFAETIQYVYDQIDQQLTHLGYDRSQLILCGRSQGAFMALYTGLSSSTPCQAIISLCGTYPTEQLTAICNYQTPVVRLEAGQESVLSQAQKDSYQLLQQAGVNLSYLLDPQSDHDQLTPSAMHSIATLMA